MKKLITKSSGLIIGEDKSYLTVFTFVFFLLFFVFSVSATAVQKEEKQKNVSKDKRVDLLEKLEKGAAITSEDITSSLGSLNIRSQDRDEDLICGPCGFCFFPPLLPFPVFHDPYYYRYDYDNQCIISDEDIREIHRQLNRSIEELRRDLESFRKSEEFRKFHEELYRWNESFRKELDKMKDEWRKEDKEAKKNNSEHTRM